MLIIYYFIVLLLLHRTTQRIGKNIVEMLLRFEYTALITQCICTRYLYVFYFSMTHDEILPLQVDIKTVYIQLEDFLSQVLNNI